MEFIRHGHFPLHASKNVAPAAVFVLTFDCLTKCEEVKLILEGLGYTVTRLYA